MINSKKVTLWPRIMKSRHLRFLQTPQDPVTYRKRANRCLQRCDKADEKHCAGSDD